MDLIKALDAPTAIVGTVGAGKTFLGKVMVEQLLHAKRRVIIIDPTGVWWGLRAGADGKPGGGFPVTIFGGDHADIAIDPDKGELLAEALAGRDVQAIVDISDMTGGEKVRFLTAFLRMLYTRNRAALHLVVDEADEVASQQPMPGEKPLLGAFDKIVRRGRVRGFRPLMITQRPAVLHKNVLSQIGTLVAMKLTSPQDRAAIEAWVKGNADAGQANEVMKSLPTLQRGEGWFWSPAAGILERRQFPPIVTFDSSRTPEVDEVVVEPALSEVDAEQLRDAMLISDASNEVEKVNKGKSAKPAADMQKLCDEAEQRGFDRGLAEGEKRGHVAGIALGLAKASSALAALRIPDIAAEVHPEVVAAAPLPKNEVYAAMAPSSVFTPERKAKQAQRNRHASATLDQIARGFSLSQTRVLRALATWKALGTPMPSREQVAMLAGYSHSSGNFGNILGGLKALAAIEYPSPGYLDLMTDFAAMTPEEAKTAFLEKLTLPQRRLVDALKPSGELTRQQLAEASGYSAGSGNFGNIVGQLRTLGVVNYPRQGVVEMAPWVFEIL